MSFLALLIGNLAVLLGSHALLRRLRSGEPTADAVVFQLLRLTLISAVVLIAGAAGGLTPLPLTIASAAALGLLLWRGEHRHLPNFRLPQVGKAVLVFSALFVLRSLAQVWFFAPFQQDAQAYHLPKIGEWIQHGGFTREWGLDLRATFPSGFELIETWWVVFLHHDVLIEMAGLEFLLLAFLAVVDLCRRMDVPLRLSVLGGLCYALTPGLCLQATSCLNDGPAAAVWTATAALVLRQQPWPLIATAACVGLGIKPTYGYAVPGLLLLAWWWRPKPLTRWTAAILVVGLAVGSSWYVRNLVCYGNPVYPVGRGGISIHDDHVAQRLGPSLSGLLQNLSRLAETRLDDHLGPYDPALPYISGWGPASFSIGLVSLFLLVRKDPSLRRMAVGYAVSLLTVLMLVVFDPWYLRFVLFFPSLLAVAAVKLAAEMPEATRILWTALVINFAGTCVPGKFPFGGVGDLAAQPWRQRTFYPFRDLQAVDALGVLENKGDEMKIYPLYRPDFSRRVVHLRAGSADELLDLLRREGLRHVYSPMNHDLLRECMANGKMIRLGVGFYEVK